MKTETILVTGGSGFIGGNLVKELINKTDHLILNIDKETYASNPSYLRDLNDNPRYKHFKYDICETSKVLAILEQYKPSKIFHLAAESHVDNSINSPFSFIQTNIVGTYSLLEAAKQYLINCSPIGFKFIHVSTDEVYGDLPHPEEAINFTQKKQILNTKFTEKSNFNPSSPYSASKASSDLLVKAWQRTYKLPLIITNCSNNFGPNQNEEKLIPKIIINALNGRKIPIYGSGKQIRDWLFVSDHVKALIMIADRGTIGETYNIGGDNEMENIELVNTILSLMEEKWSTNKYNFQITSGRLQNLIEHVNDRPGHDLRYAIDSSKLKKELGWTNSTDFSISLSKTIDWYLETTKNK